MFIIIILINETVLIIKSLKFKFNIKRKIYFIFYYISF